jgi:hypothetical protein
MTIPVTATTLAYNHGTVLEFIGYTEDGQEVGFFADHRPGWDIAAALQDGPVEVEVPPYMLTYRLPLSHSQVTALLMEVLES